ncbi:hypothetical protein BGZ76_001496 [Entomortierella beljakovae]|nr:hypothetical protein BGZ76_001496 [Entomortierella beljakovae]
MYLSISIFVNNLFLAIFQFLLLGAFGSILSIYSRYGGQYANSIRWSHHGGYFEMIACLIKSRRTIPASVSIAFLVAIIFSLLAKTADLAASHFIETAQWSSRTSTELVTLNSFFPDKLEIPYGWNTWIPYDGNITQAMALLINNTDNIHDRVEKRMYLPRTEPFDVACNQFGLAVGGEFLDPVNDVNLVGGGCAKIRLFLQDRSETTIHNLVVKNITHNQWCISIPDTSTAGLAPSITEDRYSLFSPVWLGMELDYNYDKSSNFGCGINSGMNMDVAQTTKMLPGLYSYPRTYTGSCLYKNGASIVISQTVTTFFGRSRIQGRRPRQVLKTDVEGAFYDARNASFKDPDDELLQRMEKSIMEAPESKSGKYQLVEIRSNNSIIDALVCSWYPVMGFSENLTCRCLYSSFSIITMEPKLNPYLDLEHSWPDRKYQVDMIIDHISFNDTGLVASTLMPVSISTMRDKTIEATQYRAALGQNLYVEQSFQVYIKFNIIDFQEGLYMPNWLLILIITTMVACILFWIATCIKLDERYTSSLYKMITIEMATRNSGPYPVLTKAQVYPFEVDGISVVPETDICRLNVDADAIPLVSEKYNRLD